MNRAVLLLMLVTMAAGDWAVDTALAQVEGLASRIGGQGDAGYANVRQAPYSGIGDGKADDTKAFQKALDDVGAAGGGIVFVPTGIYLIATHLTVPGGTALVGVGRAPETYSPKAPGSTLLALEGAGSREGTPFITLLGPDSTLEGITVFYPNQIVSEKPVPYPWTVRGGGGGENVSIINVLLTNPYQGVDFATNSTARHFVRGLYGQPLFKGIWVDQCYDIGRIQDVHFWPFWSQDKRIVDFTTTNGTAYIFQRTDWEVVEDIFCWGYHVGIEFSASTKGGMNGQMTDIDLDNVDIGLDVNATQPYAVHISNLNIANAGAGTEHVAIWGRKSSSRRAQRAGRQLLGFYKTSATLGEPRDRLTLGCPPDSLEYSTPDDGTPGGGRADSRQLLSALPPGAYRGLLVSRPPARYRQWNRSSHRPRREQCYASQQPAQWQPYRQRKRAGCLACQQSAVKSDLVCPGAMGHWARGTPGHWLVFPGSFQVEVAWIRGFFCTRSFEDRNELHSHKLECSQRRGNSHAEWRQRIA